MKIILLTLLALSSVAVAAPKPKSAFIDKPSISQVEVDKPTPTEIVLPPGVKMRTAQQEAELKDWIIGISKNAQAAIESADIAEKDAAASRANLVQAEGSLKKAQTSADSLQKIIDTQTKQMNEAVEAKQKAEIKEAKTAKQNNFLRTILGLEAAALAVLLCLYFRVPNLSPPWGLAATIGSPIIVFGLVKIIL